MSTADVVARTQTPSTHSTLREALDAVHLPPGSVVLIHSSLSKLGWVVGGALTVVQALTDWVGVSGTIVMPTFGGVDEPAHWKNPPVPEAWWRTIRDTAPAFDPALSPTSFMGAVVDCFRRVPGVLRSSHPTLSFAALGPAATAVIDGHSLDHSLGESSPLARVYDHDGFVLLLGVGHGNNSSLHLAEYRADCGGKTWVRQGSAIAVDGRRQWVEYDDIDYDDDDFEALGADFGRTGAEIAVPVGTGTARLMRQRPLVDFGVAWLEDHRPNPAKPSGPES